SSAQEVFEGQYGLADNFPFVFAGLAISIGLSTLLNGTMVVKLGMRRLAMIALTLFCTISIVYVGLFWNSHNPGLWILITFLAMQFFTLGFIFGNLRDIAMEPVVHIAGIGAAITGFISTMISIPIANYIGSIIGDTILPLFLLFLIRESIYLVF